MKNFPSPLLLNVRAAPWDGRNFAPVLDLLGFEVERDSMGRIVSAEFPRSAQGRLYAVGLEYETDGVVSFVIDTAVGEVKLEPYHWLVKVGNTFAAIPDRDIDAAMAN